ERACGRSRCRTATTEGEEAQERFEIAPTVSPGSAPLGIWSFAAFGRRGFARVFSANFSFEYRRHLSGGGSIIAYVDHPAGLGASHERTKETADATERWRE